MDLSPRERIIRVLTRQGGLDRIPWSLHFGASSAFTPGSYQKFTQYTGIIDTTEFYDFEVRVAHSEKKEPRFHTSSSNFGLRMLSNGITADYFNPPLPKGSLVTPWGVGLVPWPDNPGSEQMVHPLAEAKSLKDFNNYPVPEIDVESIPLVKKRVQNIKDSGHISAAYCGSLYEWSHWLRGMETFMIDLLTQPEFAQIILQKVAGFTYRFARAHAEAGVEILCFYDDYGMQSCLQVNPELWRKFLKPEWKKILGNLQSEFPDRYFFLHSCGNIEEIIPDLIEVGFDVLHPIQPECQDSEQIICQYGDRISFWGTISVQHTLPFGGREDIENEVKSRMNLAQIVPSLIVSPSNTLGQEIPVENILTYIEACQKYSPFTCKT
jgi:uroporphyrinogen decarboxylase